MSFKELKKISRDLAPFVLVLAVWACGYGAWVLGPALGANVPVSAPFDSSHFAAKIGLSFVLTGFLIFLGWIWRDPIKTAVGSGIAAFLFAFLFGSFVLTMPWTTAVPSYFSGVLLSLTVCRVTLRGVFKSEAQVGS